MKITPMFDRILVLPNEKKTESGLVLPNTNQELPLIATIVAVGKGGGANGDNITMQLTVGQVVVFNKYVGSELKVDGKDYILLRQADVMAVLED